MTGFAVLVVLLVGAAVAMALRRLPDPQPGVCRTCRAVTSDESTECEDCQEARQW